MSPSKLFLGLTLLTPLILIYPGAVSAQNGGGGGLLGLQSAGFVRGDADGDGLVDVSDPINSLKWKFLGTFDPTCLDALDADDNGAAELNDDLVVLDFLFLGNVAPESPGPMRCGEDPSPDGLGCDLFTACSCVAVEDLSALLDALIPDICVPAPIASTNVFLGDLTVCPAGSRTCADGSDGCTMEIENVVLAMDFQTKEVTITLDAVMPDLAILFEPVIGGDTNCAISAGLPLTATASVSAPENNLGLFAFQNMGSPSVTAGTLTIDPGSCGALGDLIDSLSGVLQAEFDSLIADAFTDASADLVDAVNAFLDGAQLCP